MKQSPKNFIAKISHKTSTRTMYMLLKIAGNKVHCLWLTNLETEKYVQDKIIPCLYNVKKKNYLSSYINLILYRYMHEMLTHF
jgi:hypothetical protein